MTLAWLFTFLALWTTSLGANILIADDMPSPSHQIFNYAVAELLLERGHNVTMLGPLSVKPIKHTNYHHLILEDIFEKSREIFSMEEAADIDLLTHMYIYYDYSIFACNCTYHTKGFWQLMNYPNDFKFDLIIIDMSLSRCLEPFIQKFGYPPSVGITAFLIPPFLSNEFGSSMQASYIPSFYTDFSQEMSFFERLYNYLCVYLDEFLRKIYLNPIIDTLAKKEFGDNMDSFSNLVNHISLLLVNWSPILHYPQPLSPNIIPVGGLHVKPKPLDKDLQNIMDSSKNGVVLFILGTNIQGEKMTPEKKRIMLGTFRKLKETVLWKIDMNLTDVPKNVIPRKWLPQTALLAHPNTKLFISHGGALSTFEAVHFGVPVLGIPFVVDQGLNIENLIKKKVARKVDFTTLTQESFLVNINELLRNPTYSEEVKKLSARLQDQPQTPTERTMYWLEYAMRHNGTHFLNPRSRHLTLLITSGLDVHLFLVFSICSVVFTLWKTVKIFIKLFKPSKTGKSMKVKAS